MKVIASDFKGKTSSKEKWYQTEYNEFKLPKETKDFASVSPASYPFHIPAPNELIPKNFDLIGVAPTTKTERAAALDEPPEVVTDRGVDSKQWTLWYKLDRAFKQPKIYAVISLAVPSDMYDSSFLIKSKLFNSCFFDASSEFLYEANLAGLSFDIEFTSRGVQFTISGYSDTLPLFAKRCIALLKEYKPAEATVSRFKDVLTREVNSWKSQQPYQHVQSLSSVDAMHVVHHVRT
jgi:insulysin